MMPEFFSETETNTGATEAKKVKKLLKKGLTNEITFGMIIKLLANEVHTEQTNANLENDTEQERTQRDR